MAPEKEATPDRSGSARCPRCGKDHVETYMDHGVEKLQSHARKGSTVTCYLGSHQPVQR